MTDPQLNTNLNVENSFKTPLAPLPEAMSNPSSTIEQSAIEQSTGNRQIKRCEEYQNQVYRDLFQFNQMPFAIVSSEERELLEVNTAFCQLLGRGQEFFIGQRLDDLLVDQVTAAEFEKAFDELFCGRRQRISIERQLVGAEKAIEAVINIDVLPSPSGTAEKAACVIHDITERVHQESRAVRAANYDSLTNLPNRRLFGSELDRQIELSLSESQTLGLMFLDLDGFKEINDSLGHEAGDELLVRVAERLRKTLRKGDFIARLGGDEFAVISSNCNRFNTAETAERIIEAIAEPISVSGFPVTCSVSIGLASFPEDGKCGRELLKHADVAMYEAKRNNKGFSCFRAEDSERIQMRFLLRRELEEAIEANSNCIQVFFQPRIDLNDGSINTVEALARWHHPERGNISPEIFIPIAEETTLIHKFGKLILSRVCEQILRWKSKGIHLRVAYNLADKEFERNDIVDQIETILGNYQLSGDVLEIEITETTSMKDIERSAAILAKLKAIGTYVALDDFGTGYTSFTNLKQLPADSIKIDQSFLHPLKEDVDFGSPDADIVRAVVTLANSFHMATIAEGVETESQFQFLKSLGCDFAQGYYFNAPMPAKELEMILMPGG